jgi:hypothetical protein
VRGAFTKAAAVWLVVLGSLDSAARAQTIVPPPDGLFGSLHPTYRSTYDVLRDRKFWDQSFGFSHRIDSLRVSSAITSQITEDIRQNDLRFAKSGTNHTFGYGLFPGAQVGLSANLARDNQTSTTSDVKTRNELFQLTGGLRRSLPMFLTFDLAGRAGLAHVFSSTDRSLSGQLLRSETEQDGPSVNVSTGLTRDTEKKGDIVASLTFARTSFKQTTDTRDRTFASDLASVVADSSNHIRGNNLDQNVQAKTSWARGKWLDASVTASRTTSEKVIPQPQRGGIDVTELRGDQIGTQIQIVPRDKQTIRLAYDSSVEEQRSREQESSNKDADAADFRLSGDFTRWGFEAGFSYRDFQTVSDYSPLPGNETTLFEDQDRSLKELKARLSKPLGPRLSVALRSEIALTQEFYEKKRLDRDVQDRFNDITIGYKPSAFTADLSVSDKRTYTVNTHPSQSQNTRVEHELTVRASMRYEKSSRFTSTQTLTIQAVSREFEFRPRDQADRSDLTRSTRLVTTVATKVWPVPIVLEHLYNFRNSGSYSDSDEDGVREFSLGTEFVEQQLAVSTSYTPATGLTVSGRQALKQVINRSPGGQGTRSPRYDCEIAATYARMFGGGVNLEAEATRVLSTREDRFWKIKATAAKTF